MSRSDRQLRGWLLAIVVVQFVVATWHGVAHARVPVPLTPLQTLFVVVVILSLPFFGAGMMWSPRKRDAALIITLSMCGSLVFGFLNHFVLHSPDHMTEVSEHAWRHTFVLSAALVAVTEAIGTVFGSGGRAEVVERVSE